MTLRLDEAAILRVEGPVRAGVVFWRPTAGRWRASLVVKETFELRADALALASDPLPLAGDRAWSEVGSAGLFTASDFVPDKPLVDVSLVGHAYAPPVGSAKRLVARLDLGDRSKSIRVLGNRRIGIDPEGRPAFIEEPVGAIPLSYERGIAGDDNPVGFDTDATFEDDMRNVEVDLDETQRLAAPAAPNLEAQGGGAPCFGPAPLAWRADKLHLSTEAHAWAERFAHGPERGSLLAVEEPMPEGFDFAAFNAGPQELRRDRLEPGTTLILEHLSRTSSRITLPIPSRIARATHGASALGLRCDTLWIDADRGLLALAYRGIVECGDPSTARFVVTALAGSPAHEPEPAPLSRSFPRRFVRPAGPTLLTTQVIPLDASPAPAPSPSPSPAPAPAPAPAPSPSPSRARASSPAPASAPSTAARYGSAVAMLEANPTAPRQALEDLGLSPDGLRRLERAFVRANEEAVARGDRSVETAYQAAYDANKPRALEDLSVADYAFVRVCVERGDIERALGALGIHLADLLRLQRVWRRRIAADRALADEVERAIAAERSARS